MTLRQTIYEHIKSHQEITYPEVLAYSKKCKERLVTGLRFLQADKAVGRMWGWRLFDGQENLLKPGRAWFRKRLKKPIKNSTILKV